jgi:hypothetical protein
MLSILNDTQKAIAETIIMNLDTKHALKYMSKVGHRISRPTYFRQKKKLEGMKLERLTFFSKYGFEEQHIERIDNLETVKKLMWENYEQCEDPYRKVLILEKIASIQPYLSEFYQSTIQVMLTTEKMNAYEKLKKLPSPQEVCKCGHKRTEHEWILGKFDNHRCDDCDCQNYDQLESEYDTLRKLI